MKQLGIALFCIIGLTIPVVAQDWVENPEGTLEFNCDVINEIIAEHSDSDFVRTDKQTVGVDDFFEELVPDCMQEQGEDTDSSTVANGDFSVIVNGNVNVRSCAGTNCEIVGQAIDGSILEVLGQEDDWYLVMIDGEEAYIASWLTTRGPDAIIETGDRYVIDDLGCVIVPDMKRGDSSLAVIITGDRMEDIVADIYRPNEQYALKVDSQYDKTFIDTGDVYIHQFYRWNVSFPVGLYTIEVTLDDEIVRIGWNMTERADYNIYVVCN